MATMTTSGGASDEFRVLHARDMATPPSTAMIVTIKGSKRVTPHICGIATWSGLSCAIDMIDLIEINICDVTITQNRPFITFVQWSIIPALKGVVADSLEQ